MLKEIIIIAIFMFIIRILSKTTSILWNKLWRIPQKAKLLRDFETEYKKKQLKTLEKEIIARKQYLFISKLCKFMVSFVFIIPLYIVLFRIIGRDMNLFLMLGLLILISLLVSPVSNRVMNWILGVIKHGQIKRDKK